MKKILMFFVALIVLQPILALSPIGFNADPFVIITPGGKYIVVDSGNMCKITFTNYLHNSKKDAHIILMAPEYYRVWSKKKDNITQLSANMSEGYEIFNQKTEKDSDGNYYFSFGCTSMAIKLNNDDHMLDIEPEGSL